jgi:hypothetical protein
MTDNEKNELVRGAYSDGYADAKEGRAACPPSPSEMKTAGRAAIKISVDASGVDEAIAKLERLERLASIKLPPRTFGLRVAVAIAGALFIAGYYVEQRTEQACLAAGHSPDACRTTLDDL